jgi:hypothetical protein
VGYLWLFSLSLSFCDPAIGTRMSVSPDIINAFT